MRLTGSSPQHVNIDPVGSGYRRARFTAAVVERSVMPIYVSVNEVVHLKS